MKFYINLLLDDKHKGLLVSLCLLLSLSCSKKEDLPVSSSYEKKLVVEAIFRPDFPVGITLRSNLPIDKKIVKDSFIENATSLLYENDSLIGQLTYKSQGKYSLEYFPKIKKNYNLVITAENYPIAEANVVIPEPDTLIVFYNDYVNEDLTRINIQVPVHNAVYNYCYAFARFNTFIDYRLHKEITELLNINYSLPDHPAVEFFNSTTCKGIYQNNFYTIDIFQAENDDEEPYFKIYLPNSEDVYLASATFFSNKTFIGENSVITLESHFYESKDTVFLFRVTDGLYNYLNTLAANEKTTRIGRFEGFENTIAVVSNIKNGYGCIGAITPCYLIFKNK